MKNDEGGNGLRGSVRSIRTTVARLSVKDGRLVEEPAQLPHMATFDTNRRQTGRVTYNHDGSLHTREVFTYDARGNLIKWSRFDVNGSVVSEPAYNRDPDNRKVEISSYDGNGTLIEERVQLRERKGDYEVAAIYEGEWSAYYEIGRFL